VTVNIPGTTSGQLQMLSGGESVSNYPNNVSIMTQSSSISGSGSFTFSIPAWGVAVLAVS
jgi:alpha-N-arabinofuranosidase